jgi:hypothetical protein
MFNWRKLNREGTLIAVGSGESVVPASELANARAQIAQLQRLLGTMENEMLKKTVKRAPTCIRRHNGLKTGSLDIPYLAAPVGLVTCGRIRRYAQNYDCTAEGRKNIASLKPGRRWLRCF